MIRAGHCHDVGMAEPDLDAIGRALRARQEELRARIAELAKTPERGALLGFGKRIGDGTTEAISRRTDIGVGRSLEASEARVTRALEKLDQGTYGVCDRCGRPIAPARMAASPDSVRCIDCARLP
jgi:DnaK suppressor protein